MKAIEMNASKRSSCTILVSILVGAGCAASDNNSGSLRNDSAVADGSGQVARDTQAQPADANPGYSPSPDVGAPDAASVGKDAVQVSPMADAAAPDAASTGKDAATASPEAGDAAHQCQLNANGSCSAVTSNTACTPFIGHRYDEGAGCYATAPTTLWCCATAAGDSCAWPPSIGCNQVATDGGTVAYWSTGGGEGCDQSESAKVTSAPPCGTPLVDAAAPDAASVGKDAAPESPEAGADAAVPRDAHVPVSLPLCSTDDDCCVSVDECMATATLTGNDGYGPVPGTHDTPGTCLGCIVPAIQVRCQAGFCVGTRLSGIYDSSRPLLRSHCGHIALPDAGAAVSPHAAVDGGMSYQTFWSCGSY